ncbi:MAG: delta-class carbonic anhydrase [Pseudomonadota bacterium]
MKSIRMSHTGLVVALGLFSAAATAGDDKHKEGHDEHGASGEICVGFGPQTPRDIDSKQGENKRVFTMAPSHTAMNLCNIHFHKNAEHKAKDFSIFAGEGDGHGYESGYQCNMSKQLSKAELAPTKSPICKGEHGDLKPGDTIEVHWVHSSCDVKPGQGLGSCLSESCANPELRVETQVFTLVNDPKALDFNTLDYDGNIVNGYHQAKAIPNNTGKPVEFLGSTTGPKYSEQSCSPLQVTWSVRPQCAKVDINSVGKWCEKNEFAEDHAHGVRKLVVNPKLLSEIK